MANEIEETVQLPIVARSVDAAPMTVTELKRHVILIKQAMEEVMIEGVHYGTIPGAPKPCLYKAGAEMLDVLFHLRPTYRVKERDLPDGHREFRIVCCLTHVPSGLLLGEGVGLCTTMETKYRFRQAERKCPECGKETIIKGKEKFGGGFVCWAKKGGCGAKFQGGDARITTQRGERAENENIADTYNTVLKMAKKRAHVDASLTVTAASDLYTQDLEEMNGHPTGESVTELGGESVEEIPSASPAEARPKPPKPISALEKTFVSGLAKLKHGIEVRPYYMKHRERLESLGEDAIARVIEMCAARKQELDSATGEEI